MSLLNNLLSERERVLKELADIEALLVSRCGWTQPKVKIQGENKSASQVASESDDDDPFDPFLPVGSEGPKSGPESKDRIPYIDEAVEFLNHWKGGDILISDFRDFLSSKYDKKSINEQSMRGPFPKLIKKGLLKLVRPGLGRSPGIYRKATPF